MIEMECPCCGERTKADATDGVTAPVQYGPRASALRGFEPLTSCMPCLAVWFNGIVLSRIAGGPADIGV